MSHRNVQTGVQVSKDCKEVTVHTMNPVHRGGPVFYASLTRDTGTFKEQGKNGEDAKHLLSSMLWDHLAAMEYPLWNHCQSSAKAAIPIQVASGLLGRPCLLVGGERGPAISFSTGGEKIWAALSSDESEIGIDAAGPDEFTREYPFKRVFHPQELQHAMTLTGGDLAEAAALLWSVKEAVVKALGCAFHLVDPRHINVYSSAGEDCGYAFPVGLSGKARMRFPLVASQPLWVRSLPQGTLWLSIARVYQRPTSHE